ncbi:MAG: MFS transporter [Faecalibacterium sp.]|nr:MFS transporter [Ruminococcus sp.]MCM1391448.1 MFS transporter [Ruminococcus sp.]MCM1485237.1 MFS transporter [Faecalibacterium sp.]
MLEKIKNLPGEIKSHWNTPSDGKYIPYKEFAAYSFGGIGVNTINSLFGYVGLTANCLLIGSAYGIQPTHLAYLGMIMGVLNLIKTPFISMLIDNTNSKYGKFRPYLLITGIPTALLICLMAFIPNSINYWAKVAVIGVVYAFLMIFQDLYAKCYTNLAQVLTPNSEERTGLLSVSMFIYSLGPSIVNMLLPILSSLIGGMTSFTSYRILFPIFSIIGIALSIITFKYTEEKIVVPKDYVAKVKFSDGIKQVAKNKYFWLINLYAVCGSMKYGIGLILGWYCVYQLKSDTMLGIMNTIIGTASVPLMLLAPLLAKKISKKNIIIVTNILRILFCVGMIMTIDSKVMFLVFLYLATLMLGGDTVLTSSMTAEIFDYQQWKTGTRLEGFITQFGAMLTAATGLATGLILPFFYEHYGLKSDYSVLFDASIRTPIFNVLIISTIISGLLSIIPMFFYDLKEKDHKKMIEELQQRATSEQKVSE